MLLPRRVLLTWKRESDDWLVNFLDVRSRLPLGRQRVVKAPTTIKGLVDRSLTRANGGPREKIFKHALEVGHGEIEIEVTSEQFGAIRHGLGKGKP